jgi:hypothetical protein
MIGYLLLAIGYFIEEPGWSGGCRARRGSHWFFIAVITRSRGVTIKPRDL